MKNERRHKLFSFFFAKKKPFFSDAFFVRFPALFFLVQCCRWGLISLALFNATLLINHAWTARIWLTAFNLSIAIAIGVCALSVTRCSLLTDAVDTLGGSAYIMGNFAVHYYPALKLWIYRPPLNERNSQITPSLTLLVSYLALEKANVVYGCPVPQDVITYGALGCIPLTIFVYFVSVRIL